MIHFIHNPLVASGREETRATKKNLKESPAQSRSHHCVTCEAVYPTLKSVMGSTSATVISSLRHGPWSPRVVALYNGHSLQPQTLTFLLLKSRLKDCRKSSLLKTLLLCFQLCTQLHNNYRIRCECMKCLYIYIHGITTLRNYSELHL